MLERPGAANQAEVGKHVTSSFSLMYCVRFDDRWLHLFVSQAGLGAGPYE